MSNPAPGFRKKPLHTVEIEPCARRMRASFAGTVIAESDAALCLREASYPPVVYFPPDALAPEHFEKTDHTSYCPFKGTASYWSIVSTAGSGDAARNAVWGYEDPYDECEAIRGFVAFYQDRVGVEEVAE